eukprot:82314-Prorocentrum_lima.AAC.1
MMEAEANLSRDGNVTDDRCVVAKEDLQDLATPLMTLLKALCLADDSGGLGSNDEGTLPGEGEAEGVSTVTDRVIEACLRDVHSRLE